VKTPDSPYPPPIVIKLVRGLSRVLSRLIWRIEFHGTENIPPNSSDGLVIAANHQTYLDAFWVIAPVNRRFRFMAWDKAFNVFGIGSLIRYLGAFPVNIEHGDKEAYQKSVEVLRDGATLVIFPEGSRAFTDGELLDFKTGAVRMAIEAGVPILPVTIRGANQVWSREMKYPRPFEKVAITYHSLMKVSPPAAGSDSREHARALTEKLKEIIKQSL
jgi:1-acyl-sn-glycerol-3-phosphate acyltransferase